MTRRFFACTALLLAAPLTAQSTPAEPASSAGEVKAPPTRLSELPVEAFGRLPHIDVAKLSPNGRYLAGLLGVQGQQMIAMVNLFNPGDKPVYLVVPDDTEAAWVDWVNDDNIIVGLTANVPRLDGERWIVSRLIGINRTTRKFTKLLWRMHGQNAAGVVWLPTDGSSSIMVQAQNSIFLDEDFWPSVYRVNVVDGDSSQVVRGQQGVTSWQADGTGRVRSGLGTTNEGRDQRLLYRPSAGQNSFKVIDRAKTRNDESLLNPLLFLPGTDNALVLREDERGVATIDEIDMTTQQQLRQVFASPQGSEISGTIVSADETTLLGVSLGGGDPRTHWLEPNLAEIQSALDKSVAPRRARIISMSADRSILLVRVDRPENPGVLYYFNTAGAKMQRIGYVNAAIGAQALSPVKLVQYKARDGLQIEAVMTLPRDRPHKNLPIVMLPHGGPWAQDSLTYDYWAQFLASRGYLVMQPNFRGSTGYGAAFTRAGEGQMGKAMQDDITDGLNWAAKEGLADPNRACIVGASYGGYAAMWGLVKDPDLYRCAISIAGVANVRREVNDFGDYLFGGKFKDDWQKMSPDFTAISPANYVHSIRAPLLLIHGKKDITVDFAQSEGMYGRMRGAGKAVEFLPLKDADHHFTREADRIALLKAMEAFLAKNNPADPEPRDAK